jgi:hypothetical protein
MDELRKLVPDELSVDNVLGRQLMIKREAGFVAQIQSCSEDAGDTMDDLQGVKNPPAAFAEALEKRTLQFLLVTFAEAERGPLKTVIDAFLQSGAVKFDPSQIPELG